MTQKRLLSLDIFRGITVAFMIIVNNPGDWSNLYWPLEHAKWHGCTPTDLVFPFFLFIVGVAIPLADANSNAIGSKYQKIIIRGIKLFGLGLFLSLFPKFNLETVRIMGVLQRIALVYMVCSIFYLTTKSKSYNNKLRVIYLIISLLGYFLLISFVNVPGVGPANLEPETNLGAWIDRTLLTEPHLWKAVKTWDPEGLLGTLPATANCIFGIIIGQKLIEQNKTPISKIKWIFFLGLLAMAIGLMWDNLGFPLNKSLWTSSYALFTSGLAILFLGLLYYIIDYKAIITRATFFTTFGQNAILAFFLSGLIPRILSMAKLPNANGELESFNQLIYNNWLLPHFNNPKLASLAAALLFLIILFIPFNVMRKNKIFIKI